MVRTKLGRWMLRSRASGIVATHPRIATVLVLGVLLLATSGTAAAGESFATTTGEGVTKTGP